MKALAGGAPFVSAPELSSADALSRSPASTWPPYDKIINDMNYTAIREYILAAIIFTLAGACWGWWPLFGFLQGALCFLWLIALLLEKVVGNG